MRLSSQVIFFIRTNWKLKWDFDSNVCETHKEQRREINKTSQSLKQDFHRKKKLFLILLKFQETNFGNFYDYLSKLIFADSPKAISVSRRNWRAASYIIIGFNFYKREIFIKKLTKQIFPRSIEEISRMNSNKRMLILNHETHIS